MVAQLPDPIKIVRRAGDVRIHTFISGFTDDNIANATHIIESKNKLVLVDGQFLVPYALQFREYANSIGKKIERLYLSHRHPDHWFGLGAAFSDIPIYALPETIEFLKQHGEDSLKDHWKMGNLAPKGLVIPEETVRAGEEIIDGVKYVFDEIIDTEIDFLLTIGLPDVGIFVAQDLIYSGTHLYLTKYMEHWIAILQDVLLSEYDIFLPGHGFPADKNEVAKNIEYLSVAIEAAGKGLANENFKRFMLERFPERKCPAIFDIYMPRLFDNASEF
ncbi:MBL fold metallo-hydrolase [Sinorhizobium meliloti]|uniref:MBL fold metallo-hydrolase n=1 Tax=Rhizobium meliloti TaxID=382 RepID=UPI0001E4E2A4|nr:MBL fold metallo-hydrolase [Sinorhizobium meliloti]AEG07102.1 beta-lactamase domain protein [Sinorhizobium meliloti BL225C]ASQ01906.1 MBL fold metallo-hydrolase [Sinorhizobium meliloti]ASQ12623.1 MBL fold metallo-hydrolase [Sinorhizobium meliloti]MCO6425993.1 MBL fold metallo-hydrolase [Sinorhizobium meliloti]MDE3774655.1 MBL fold metallo-hydrolase [Sinorhizobium meliloti]